jgi:hypothetical protein
MTTNDRVRTILRALALGATAAIALSAPVARTARASDQSDPRSAPRAPQVDGRGLATFGDRALTPYSDRMNAYFSQRPLESVAPVGLAPMGGMSVPSSVDARWPTSLAPKPDAATARRQRPLHWRCAGGPFGLLDGGAVAAASNATPVDQTVSIAGVAIATAATTPDAAVVLPPVKLPAVTLDDRGALAAVEAALRSELADARARGDVDFARSLAERLER